MAYANLVKISSSSKEETFQRIRDFLCKRNGTYDYSTTGIGWTLHDSFYAVDEDNLTVNDYVVIKSVGESGDDDLYCQIKFISTSNYLLMVGWQYWNNSTHVGNGQYNTTNSLNAPETTCYLWIYGDLSTFYLLTTNLTYTTTYCSYFGLWDSTVMLDPTVAVSASAVSAGSSVVVTVDAVPSSWAVGGSVLLKDNTEIERSVISDINGLDVTLVNVVNSYDAGVKLAKEFPYICSAQFNFGAQADVLYSHNGTRSYPVSPLTTDALAGFGKPDPAEGQVIAVSYHIGVGGVMYGGILRNVFQVSPDITKEGVYTLADGTNYRAFWIYSAEYFILKEV